MEDYGAVLVIVFWIAIALLSKIASAAKKRQQERGGPPPVQAGALETMLRQIAKEAGLYQEPPVVSEHAATASEHRGTFGEHAPTASESRRTVLEHHQAEIERRRTESEARGTFGEHEGTVSEHLRGDAVVLPPIPSGLRPRRRSSLGAALAKDLHGGSRALARAVMLREILGPPVSLGGAARGEGQESPFSGGSMSSTSR